MQKLSLPITQNTPLKNMSDVANKSDVNADKSTSGAMDVSFQAELSKQVQAKKNQNGHEQNKQSSPKQVLVKQVSVKSAAAEHGAVAQKSKSKADNSQPDTDPASKLSTELSEQLLGLDPKMLLGANGGVDAKPERVAKKDEEPKSENIAINTVDMDSIALISAIPVSVVNVIPEANTQSDSDAALTPVAIGGADGRLTSMPEATTQKSQGLDAVLSSALSQGRNVNVSEKDVVDIPDGKSASGQARWLDAVLPNALRQATGDEPTGKLILNAAKEVAGKDVIMASSFQPPVAQINAALQTQQVASASSINAYPGKPGWDQAISQKVVWMVGAGEQSATLTLNPPDLGPLQVVIHVHNDQADATFISDNAVVRQALEDGLSNLRDKMGESGIQLGQANVNSSGQSQQEFQQATQNRMASQLNSADPELKTENLINTSTLVRVSNGLVDTFA